MGGVFWTTGEEEIKRSGSPRRDFQGVLKPKLWILKLLNPCLHVIIKTKLPLSNENNRKRDRSEGRNNTIRYDKLHLFGDKKKT